MIDFEILTKAKEQADKHNMDLIHTIRKCGVKVVPSNAMSGGEMCLIISPELWEKVTSGG